MKKVSKLINFPEKIIDDIEEYQRNNGIASFTATVLELVRKGLKKEEVKETVDLGELVNDLKEELENGEVKRSVAFLDLVLSNGDVWTMLEEQLEEEGY